MSYAQFLVSYTHRLSNQLTRVFNLQRIKMGVWHDILAMLKISVLYSLDTNGYQAREIWLA